MIGTTHTVDNREMYDLTNLPLLISFGAGGIAGQAHYMVSHYLRQWRQARDHVHHRLRHVTVGGTCVAFFPTAISFMAFQYGGELTERFLVLEED